MIAIDSIKQPALDADLKAIQQINLTGNLGKVGDTTIFYIFKRERKYFTFFHQELSEYCNFISL